MPNALKNNHRAHADQPERMALTSGDVAAAKRAELIEALKAIMPGAVAEGRVDLKQIAAELGDDVTVSEKERFGLNWPGRDACMRIIQRLSTGTLKPCAEESVDFDTTENLFIEGDNLEVLKLLQTAYHNRVKMIYIDPPYNTGNEFIYPDKFSETLKNYLDYTGQLGENDRALSTDEDRIGRFHSNWLNMMHPRLYLARTLLRDDGVIFISIDDNEFANLKALCDILFGEENFIELFSWQKTTTPSNLSQKTKKTVEYILLYQKQDCGALKGLSKHSKSTNGLMNQTNPVGVLEFPGNIVSTNLQDGIYAAGQYGTSAYEIHLLEDTEVKNGLFIRPVRLKGKFKWAQPYLNQQIADKVKLYIKTESFSPSYEKEEYAPEKPWNLLNSASGVGTNENASSEVDALMGTNFSDDLYPKPVSLIKFLANTLTQNDDIILDFFSGSGTTAHAVMDLNAEDGGNRKFICVQLPEPCDENTEAFKAGYKTIADIGKERIRRAGAKLKGPSKRPTKDKAQVVLPGFGDDDTVAPGDVDVANLDVGFKVFKLDKSTLLPWNMPADEFDESGAQLDQHVLHLDGQAREQDILYELLLKSGFPLETKIEVVKMAGKEVHSVEDGALLICLDKELTTEVIDAMAAADPLEVICLDEGFQNNDQLKTNAVQAFKSRARSKETQIVFKTV